MNAPDHTIYLSIQHDVADTMHEGIFMGATCSGFWMGMDQVQQWCLLSCLQIELPGLPKLVVQFVPILHDSSLSAVSLRIRAINCIMKRRLWRVASRKKSVSPLLRRWRR